MAIHYEDGHVAHEGRVLRIYWDDVRIMSDVWGRAQLAEVVEPGGALHTLTIYIDGRPGTRVVNPEADWADQVCSSITSAEVDATDAAKAEHAAWNEACEQARAERIRKAAAEREAAERKAPRKGRTVRVVRGRKVPKGTEGVCIWVGMGDWGERCGIKDAAGNVYWTASKNVEAISA